MDLVVNCNFTKDGKYLHVATFQYHSARQSASGFKCDSEQASGRASINFIMYTYRLCAQRPTRSPPVLIHIHDDMRFTELHKAKIGTKFPCTFTWTDSHLYIVWSNHAFNVHRIPLFLNNAGKGAFGGSDLEIELVKRNIPIPASAEEREVLFFPSPHDASARIIVGMQNKSTTKYPAKGDILTPLGCNVDIFKDFEGWTKRTYTNSSST